MMAQLWDQKGQGREGAGGGGGGGVRVLKFGTITIYLLIISKNS